MCEDVCVVPHVRWMGPECRCLQTEWCRPGTPILQGSEWFSGEITPSLLYGNSLPPQPGEIMVGQRDSLVRNTELKIPQCDWAKPYLVCWMTTRMLMYGAWASIAVHDIYAFIYVFLIVWHVAVKTTVVSNFIFSTSHNHRGCKSF